MPKKLAGADADGSLSRHGPVLTVTDQQSRFHIEASEHSNLKEIVVKDLSISLGNRELLSHAELHLQPGRKYVLAGRNGIGKSTLLRAIATDQVPSIPRSVRVLLLGQTEVVGLDAASAGDQTVLQHVLTSDRRRERLLHEAEVLSRSLEAKDATAAVLAFRKVSHERLEDTVAEARLIATRRSGARGKKARERLIQLEAELDASLERSMQALHLIEPSTVAAESSAAADMLTQIQTDLELMGAAATEAKARTVLLGLGFSQASIDAPFTNLSGGWRTRCSLACALCQTADLLFLDEPTNYLDLPSIIWLEKYIVEIAPPTIVVVVTHDRTFADAVAEELLVLRQLTLQRFRGNLSSYELDRYKQYKYLSRMKDAQAKQKAHMEKTVANSINAAKRHGDDKKLKQAASRKKKLEERSGMEVSAKGTRFKLNRDLAGHHLTNRAEIELPDFDPPVQLVVPTSPSDLRFPGPLVSLEKVSFAYKGSKTLTLREIDLTVHLGERVGIAGLNGAGKSTLVSVVIGINAASQGSVTRHPRVKLGLYSQQSVEELTALASEQPQLTALSYIMSTVQPQEQEARAMLSGLGLQGRVASDVPLGMLSGGQKVRVALAKLLNDPPHLLILDEVTTHLDADTIEALILTLRAYEGALLIITHDRFFMRCVVEGESPKTIARESRTGDAMDDDDEDEASDEDEDGEGSRPPGVVYRLAKGRLTKLESGMEQYATIAAKAAAKLTAA